MFLVFVGAINGAFGCANNLTKLPFHQIKYPYSQTQELRSKRSQTRVHIAQLGQIDAQRPSIVLLHPWGSNMLIWRDLAQKLARKHHIVLIDLPGHGKTSKPIGRYPPKRMAYATLDVIEHLELDQPILIGNSLGGATAIEVAILAPEKIQSIALIGVPGGAAHPSIVRKVIRKLTHPHNVETVAPGIVHILWWFVAQTLNPLSLETVATSWVHPRHTKQWPLYARAMSASLGELLRWKPNIERIKVPSLIIQGSRDLVVWPWLGTQLSKRIPHAQYQELNSCGHFPQLQCLNKLVQILEPFIEKSANHQRK